MYLRVEEVSAQEQNQTVVTCSTSCSLDSELEYVWHKNGQILQDRTTASIPVYEVASYSCAVRGHEDLRSPAVCVPDKLCWGVTYSYENICVLMGSSVDIRLTTKGGQNYSGSPGVTISVTDLQVWASLHTVKEGDKVTLTCNTTCTLSNDPIFIWYKNGEPVTYKRSTRDKKLHINPVSSEDAGIYSCVEKGHKGLSSTTFSLNVRYKPKNVLASITASSKIEEGSLVTLTCSSDANPPVYTYTWLMKNGVEAVRGTGESISFNVTSDTSGLYYCEAHNELGSQISFEVAVQTG
ncbi:B-cell receptor CD22-like [Sardina pilchardus]|uniref:B-cell receptor CD22-like n=1 Tax=Sardina pilchardus TaxID=27697 RepID=UPI002E106688